MTSKENRLREARATAQRKLSEFGVTDPADLDLERMAAACGADVIHDELDGAMARVMRIGKRARIYISKRIDDPGAIRFSIAHELAHLWLGHELRGDERIGERVCAPLNRSETNPEREASVCAAEVLMPESYVRTRCRLDEVALEQVRTLAAGCGTSLLASALRFVELSPARCAVVYSELGRVRWVKRSPTFDVWIPRGRRVDARTVAAGYFARGAVENGAELVPMDAWFPKTRPCEPFATLREHAIPLSDLGAVFSLLWQPV